jgi:predicted benzoate:H+ symporter BenE
VFNISGFTDYQERMLSPVGRAKTSPSLLTAAQAQVKERPSLRLHLSLLKGICLQMGVCTAWLTLYYYSP